MQKNIRVGVDDWLKFGADGQFYPEDMPVEWRLSYFANEFETACIQLNAKMLSQSAEIEWLEDLPAGFGLYFAAAPELTTGAAESDFLPQLKKLKSVILRADIVPAGHFLSDGNYWGPQSAEQATGPASAIALLPADADLKQYRQWIELWAQQCSQQQLLLWLDGRQATAARLNELRMLVELMGF